MPNVWAQLHPMRAGRSVGKPDAAGVDHALVPDCAVELHVRMPTDDDVGLDAGEDLPQALVGGRAEKHLLVAPRRAMAEQHAPETLDFELELVGAGRQPLEAFRPELLLDPFVVEIAVGVPPDRERIERPDAIDGLDRQRSPGDVAAEDEPAIVADRREGSLERGKVPVNVVERSDARATRRADRRWSPEPRRPRRPSPASARAAARAHA